MPTTWRLSRFATALLAGSSLCMANVPPALAQPAPPGGADQAGVDGSDPPALAGRLASVTGSVSFHAAGETQWSAASLNYPVTTGEAFWTEPQAAATLEVADSRVVMADSTELDVVGLDQTQFSVTEPQGALFLALTTVPSPQGVSVNTPRGTVQINEPGRYEIVAGDTDNATTISVVEGAAHITGSNLSLDVGPQQTATIGGTDTLQGSVGALQQDAFLQAQLAAPRRRVAAALPQQARYMTGAADLQQYGNFSQNTQYGQVWYPNDVPQDWAPYRDGRWSYMQPWGWTWVDNAPWGFAPFHYGRWVQVDDRWGWVAGGGGEAVEADAYPVYSPALVSFLDVGGAALAGAAIGFGAAELVGGYAPAWVPLGPREPYYPWYHTRADYFARVNRPYGVPRDVIARGPTYITNINRTTINNTTINRINFINRRGATVSPPGAFARGEALRGVARPLPERALAEARPVGGRLPVRPTAFTPNLPPAAARRFGVTLPPRPVRAVAAGPRIQPGPAIGERGRVAPPALRHVAPPANVRPTPVGEVRGGREGGREGGPGAPALRPGGSPAPARGPETTRPPGGPEATRPQRGPEATRPPGGPEAARPLRGPEAAGPRAGAPGPAIGPRGTVPGLPALRAPGARPEAVPPGGAATSPPRRGPTEPGNGGPLRPGVERTPPARPGAAGQPTRPERGETPRPQAGTPPRPGVSEAPRPPRSETPRAEAPRNAGPRPEAPRAPSPASRPEAPRPQAPRPEAPRPQAPRPEAPRPQAPRPEAPRPAPRAEAPRPAPRPEAPRPAPRPEPPRAAPPPRPAPHPAPPEKKPPPH